MAKKKNEKTSSITNRIRQFKAKLSYPILKQPQRIKKMKTNIIVFTIIASFLLDMLSFTLKGSESAIRHGNVAIAIVMLMLYFSQRVFTSSYNTFKELQNDLFQEAYNSETTLIIMDVCNKTRSKVFKEDDGKETVVANAETIQKSKGMLNAVWNFWWTLPIVIADIITFLVTIGGLIYIELSDNSGNQTLIIMCLLAICVIIYILLAKKRIICKKAYRKIRKENESKEDVLFTEIKNIEFVSENDFTYHAMRFREQLVTSVETNKAERLKLNKVFIKRSLISTGFMILILIIKSYSAETIDLSTILDIIAVSSVYSTILGQISDIISRIETLADTVIDINTLSPDFDNIYSVYTEENAKVFSDEPVESITCNNFSATQDPKKMYLLKNKSPFVLQKGDFVLIDGPTGCGKSTFLMLITGKLKIKNNPIIFSNGENGYLKSIAYQTDKAIANNYVINELILSDDTSNVDEAKVLEIMHGLTLYPELLRMANSDSDLNSTLSDDQKVIEFLKIRKVHQFSSGQQQRIALAKLLYSMTDKHQVISLDEAFNRLDDSTAKKCIKFVYDYTQRSMLRIVLLATHQVDLVKPICNKEITFTTDMNNSYLNVSSI